MSSRRDREHERQASRCARPIVNGSALLRCTKDAARSNIVPLATQPQRKPSKAELDASVRLRLIDGIVSTVQGAVKWLSLLGIAGFVYLAIRSVAGQHTFADIGIKFIGDLKINQGLSYLFGVGGVGYGMRERRLRRKTIERLSRRNVELEKMIDPDRTSSHLTTRGTTNPEDSI